MEQRTSRDILQLVLKGLQPRPGQLTDIIPESASCQASLGGFTLLIVEELQVQSQPPRLLRRLASSELLRE